MDETTLGIIYLALIVISIVALISFFYLCYNVSEIKKYLVDGVRREADITEKKED